MPQAMKGWRKRQDAAVLRMQHKRVDLSIREQRAKVLAEAKANSERPTEVYDTIHSEADVHTAVVLADQTDTVVTEDDENQGAIVEDNDGPAQPNVTESPANETVDEPVVENTGDSDPVVVDGPVEAAPAPVEARKGRGKK